MLLNAKRILVVLCLLTFSSLFAHAQEIIADASVDADVTVEVIDDTNQEVPTEPQPTTDDKITLLLAKSYVAEAGWDGVADHIALSYVLKDKAESRNKPFDVMIKQYVALYRNKVSRKSRWKKRLQLTDEEPRFWPANLSWTYHVPLWQTLIARAKDFQLGLLSNPCPGAKDWGGAMDKPRGRQVRMKCLAKTKNIFYRYNYKT